MTVTVDARELEAEVKDLYRYIFHRTSTASAT